MLADKFKYYKDSINRKGIIELARQMISDYYYNKKFKGFSFSTAAVYTRGGGIEANEVIQGNALAADAKINTPSSYYYIFKCFGFIPIPKNEVNLLDLGCGNGKVLVAGIKSGFGQVLGVDIDQNALKAARENCKKAEQFNSGTRYEILFADAGTFEIPANINTVFLYNPFGEATLQKVIENLDLSYRKSKREIYILYYGPAYRALFNANPGYEIVCDNRVKSGYSDFIIYRRAV